jgi:hypothetical protein
VSGVVHLARLCGNLDILLASLYFLSQLQGLPWRHLQKSIACHFLDDFDCIAKRWNGCAYVNAFRSDRGSILYAIKTSNHHVIPASLQNDAIRWPDPMQSSLLTSYWGRYPLVYYEITIQLPGNQRYWSSMCDVGSAFETIEKIYKQNVRRMEDTSCTS